MNPSSFDFLAPCTHSSDPFTPETLYLSDPIPFGPYTFGPLYLEPCTVGPYTFNLLLLRPYTFRLHLEPFTPRTLYLSASTLNPIPLKRYTVGPDTFAPKGTYRGKAKK